MAICGAFDVRDTFFCEQNPVNVKTTCVLASDTIRDYMWRHRVNNDAQTIVSTWIKPQADWLKCISDCARFEAEGKSGVCVIFQDNLGHFIQVHSMIFPSIATAGECEATPIQQAVQIALDSGSNQVVFESDCQTIVNAMNNNNYYGQGCTWVRSTRKIQSNPHKKNPKKWVGLGHWVGMVLKMENP